jgi:hypothetical protein
MADLRFEDLRSEISDGSDMKTKKKAMKKGKGELGKYRRNGNVARLPKAVRDRINVMIQDGLPYKKIIQSLGEDGKGLGISNLSHWKDGGYQDWLVEQAFIARTRARQETPAELVRNFDATEVNHAALQLGTLHIFDALRDLGPGTLNQKLGGDCAAFARLLNALARASRETMMLQKYREACSKAREALRPLKDLKRKLSDSERLAIVRNVDEIFGIAEEEPGDPESANSVSPLSEVRRDSPGSGNGRTDLSENGSLDSA